MMSELDGRFQPETWSAEVLYLQDAVVVHPAMPEQRFRARRCTWAEDPYISISAWRPLPDVAESCVLIPDRPSSAFFRGLAWAALFSGIFWALLYLVVRLLSS